MSSKTKREKQSIIVRGIAASIQSMAMPTYANLKELLSKFGWSLTRSNPQTNESDEGNQ